jgi:hypothetical protein
MVSLIGQSADKNSAGVLGEGVTPDISDGGTGVYGRDRAGKGNGVIGYSANGRGVWGHTDTGIGVLGESVGYQGVLGKSRDNAGIVGDSENFHAVFGISHSPNNGGVFGANDKGGWGVVGRSDSNTGVSGESNTGVGVHGKGGRLAGFFEGDVEVTGNLTVDHAKVIPSIAIVNSSQGSTHVGPFDAGPISLTLSENGHYVVFARVVIQNDDNDPQNISASITDDSDPPSVFDRLDVRVPGRSPSAFSLQATLVFSDAHERTMRVILRCSTFNGTALQPSIFALRVSDFKKG